MIKYLSAPLIVSVIVLAAVYWWSGMAALLVAIALAVLEITFSFDNAIINAKVLEKMNEKWKRRFLTWGVLVSVVIMRFVLPILIVSVLVSVSPVAITMLTFFDPVKYAELIKTAEPAIKAFGGTFLLLVALRYFFDSTKEVHWFSAIESRFARWGQVEAIGVAFTLIILFLISMLAPGSHKIILESGVLGTILFIAVEGFTQAIGFEASSVAKSGLALFLYINVLDMAFSFDSVVGAFAITVSVPVIVAGLGIGAYFVRSLTLMLVRGNTLKRLMYLEHGAHWAILALALSMFMALITPVPEWFVAAVGVVIILFAYLSSRRVLAYDERMVK